MLTVTETSRNIRAYQPSGCGKCLVYVTDIYTVDSIYVSHKAGANVQGSHHLLTEYIALWSIYIYIYITAFQINLGSQGI